MFFSLAFSVTISMYWTFFSSCSCRQVRSIVLSSSRVCPISATLRAEAADLRLRFRRSLLQGGDLLPGLPLPLLQGLAFREVLLPSRGEIGDLPPGEVDPLLLDVDGVFRAVELFLVGRR